MPNLRMRLVTQQTLNEDIQNTLDNIDNLSALALSLPSSGPQGFQQFIELRDSFRNKITKLQDAYATVTMPY